jgi:hypothetical protein
MTKSFYGELLIALLVLVELGVVGWYFLHWDLFPKYSIRRLFPWSVLISSILGIPLLQIYIYRTITAETIVGDVMLLIISLESILSTALMFYLLLRRRTQRVDSE